RSHAPTRQANVLALARRQVEHVAVNRMRQPEQIKRAVVGEHGVLTQRRGNQETVGSETMHPRRHDGVEPTLHEREAAAPDGVPEPSHRGVPGSFGAGHDGTELVEGKDGMAGPEALLVWLFLFRARSTHFVAVWRSDRKLICLLSDPEDTTIRHLRVTNVNTAPGRQAGQNGPVI